MTAIFYQTSSGDTGLRVGPSLAFPIPQGAAQIEFDAAANPELLESLNGRVPGFMSQDHAIDGDRITRKGEPLTIKPAIAPPKTRTDDLVEWVQHFRESLKTASTLSELKTADTQHPPTEQRAK